MEEAAHEKAAQLGVCRDEKQDTEKEDEVTCCTIPSAWPLGTMVALWIGCAPSVWKATSACPLS